MNLRTRCMPLHSLSHRSACLASAIALAITAPAAHAQTAPQVEFSDGFLIGGKAIDMRRYVQGNPVEAGDHRVDVRVNGQLLQTRDITFVADAHSDVAAPCIPLELAQMLELQPQYAAQLAAAQGQCVDLPGVIDGATVNFDSSALQLLLTVPQAAQARQARGLVATDQRDPGISALFFNYTANHYRSNGNSNSYLGLRAGLNLGDWRLRHRASVSHGRQGTRHTLISSHAQRDLPAWNSQLLLGEGNTGGELFESVAFSGARVFTDERMLPDSLRGFAPTVQGIAEGNAVVSVRQNGIVIHETTVAPGPFVIDDMYPTSFGGDLEVTVTEADGRSQRFNVNFSAVPQALRAGASRFSATAGVLRDGGGQMEHLRFAEGTYVRGISNRLTTLGGVQLAQGYQAVLGGAAVNTGIGAFGADITRSRARTGAGPAVAGNSFRVNYQRYVARTGTNFGLAAYRYSTRGFLSLNDTARAHNEAWGYGGRARQRYQLNFSQRLGERGNLYLTGGHVAYWDSTRRQNDFQLGYQGVAGRVNYGVSALRYRLGDGRLDTRYAINLAVPLGRSSNAPRASTQVSHAAGGQQVQLGLNGSLGERRALTYTLSTTRDDRSGSSSNAYASYLGSHANLSASYTRNAGSSSQTFGAAGSLVLHRGGINFGQTVGEGFALVHAPGAQGASVGSGSDIRVARNGFALLPHISPYRWNRIDLDPSGLPLEVELLQTSQRVAPTAGSIVHVPFEVRRERTLFIDATDRHGQPLPFAARVQDQQGRTLGAVGQGGVIQLRGAQDEGILIVDPDGPQRCQLYYQMPAEPDVQGLSWSEAVCAPPPLPGLQADAAGSEHPAGTPVPTAPR
ncbi:fimbria/pilus outer membrane usher protein [Stenotrophomonas sp. ATs4]|uniref:fimbria/pilus outer membrane usher protein n=1 Tax=Stenotrophomonas sp. ATs4 TaxID=3402766 RepID=UPI003F70FEC2